MSDSPDSQPLAKNSTRGKAVIDGPICQSLKWLLSTQRSLYGLTLIRLRQMVTVDNFARRLFAWVKIYLIKKECCAFVSDELEMQRYGQEAK